MYTFFNTAIRIYFEVSKTDKRSDGYSSSFSNIQFLNKEIRTDERAYVEPLYF